MAACVAGNRIGVEPVRHFGIRAATIVIATASFLFVPQAIVGLFVRQYVAAVR
jgi:hypothetical protein